MNTNYKSISLHLEKNSFQEILDTIDTITNKYMKYGWQLIDAILINKNQLNCIFLNTNISI